MHFTECLNLYTGRLRRAYLALCQVRYYQWHRVSPERVAGIAGHEHPRTETGAGGIALK